MAERHDTLRISVTAREAVEIERSLVLSSRHLSRHENAHWRRFGWPHQLDTPRYKIELTGLQLADMGAPNTDDEVTIDFDVTPLVNTGKLRVL